MRSFSCRALQTMGFMFSLASIGYLAMALDMGHIEVRCRPPVPEPDVRCMCAARFGLGFKVQRARCEVPSAP